MLPWFLLLLSTFCVVAAVVGSGTNASGQQRWLITSAEQNIRSEAFEQSGTLGDHKWSVRQQTLHGGKQEGVQLITIDNGALQIDVIPTRGMSILEVRSGEMRLGWDSPVKEVVHPQHIDLESRGGLGWLEGFNELLVRCGLESAGAPGTDEFVDNSGQKISMELTLHGKIGNTPASEVEVIVDDQPPHRIRVRGIVHERGLFGPNLQLVAEVSMVPGERAFRVDDQVMNLGAIDQEFQLIYHTNFGPPLLEEGAKVHPAAKNVAPLNEHAASRIDDFTVYDAPTAGFVEMVYLIEPYADEAHLSRAVLRNAAGDWAASIAWSTDQLPYLTVWKNTAAIEDGYVTGLEPATGFPHHRGVERRAGRVPKLAPQETRQFGLQIELHRDASAVAEAIEQVRQIVDNRATHVDR